MEEMSSQELQNLAPTKGIERHTTDYLDRDFSVWDLGGQASYRETYLSKPEIFNQTKAMIFVVDIQDIDRIEMSYQYFIDILQILKNVDPAPKLYVLFHKYDPEIAGKLKSHFYRAARLFRKADQITPNKFKFYLTSIYSNSIDLAVKRILFENFDDFEEPSDILETKPKTVIAAEKEIPAPAAPGVSSIHNAPAPTPKSDEPTPVPAGPPETAPAPVSSSPKPKTAAPIPKTSAPQPTITSAPAPQRSAPEPKVEETKVDVPVEKTPESEPFAESESAQEEKPVTQEQEVEQATPTNLFDLSEDLVTKLTEIVERRMHESPEIVALSILSAQGKQVLAVGKSSDDYEKLETLKDVVGALNPKQFYKELSDIEYRGLGHFSLESFDIYFARVSDDYAIAIIAIDVSTLMLQNAQRIVNSIRQGMGMMDGNEDAPDEPGADKPKIKKKTDLVQDLRSRLKGLSGLNDLE